MGKLAELKLVTLKVNQINPAPYNPRKDLQPGDIEYERIARSIDTFGYVEPLVWNVRSGNLVGGHQRFKILLERGATHMQVSEVDLSAEDEQALNIALNKLSGEWDQTKLVEVLLGLHEANYDVSLSGFDESEIRKLLEHEEENTALDPLTPKHAQMEIRPYEHYDYLVFFFRDSRDFVAACEKFGIKKVEAGFSSKKSKLGVGRVLDGARLLNEGFALPKRETVALAEVAEDAS